MKQTLATTVFSRSEGAGDRKMQGKEKPLKNEMSEFYFCLNGTYASCLGVNGILI